MCTVHSSSCLLGGVSASLHAGIHPPPPPGFGPGDTPGQTLNLPSPGCGPGDPPPPWTEFLTHASENITLPATSFAGGKK